MTMRNDRTAPLGVIAGNNRYPFLTLRAARAAGVPRLGVIAFEGETDPAIAELADEIAWLRVGQLGKMLRQFKAWSISRAIMAGQIAPKNLFELRPDFRALLLLGRLRERNAESPPEHSNSPLLGTRDPAGRRPADPLKERIRGLGSIGFSARRRASKRW